MTETEYYPDGTVKVKHKTADNNLESMPNITEIMRMFLPQKLDRRDGDDLMDPHGQSHQVFPTTAGQYGNIGNLAMGMARMPMAAPGLPPFNPQLLQAGLANPQLLQGGLLNQAAQLQHLQQLGAAGGLVNPMLANPALALGQLPPHAPPRNDN